MSVQITAESEQGLALQESVRNRISTFGLDEDLNFVAQYIVVMISNGNSPENISGELQGLFGDKFDNSFSEWAIEEALRIQNGQGPSTYDQAMEEDSGDVAPIAEVKSAFPESHTHQVSFNTASMPTRALPTSNMTEEEKLRQRISRFGGSSKPGSTASTESTTPSVPSSSLGSRIGKNANQKRRIPGNFANGGADAFVARLGQDGQGDRNLDSNNTGFDALGRKQLIRERCSQWPNCQKGSSCDYVHPTKPCVYYPSCSHAVGTCTFLHVGEDPLPPGLMIPEEIQAQMRGAAEQYRAKFAAGGFNKFTNNNSNQNRDFGAFQRPQQTQQQPQGFAEPQIKLCRFTSKCANTQCAFGHPTPANNEARVTDLEWCPSKDSCADAGCAKAHASGSLVRAPEPIPEKVLETCRFLDRCTNPRCRYRHPRSHVVCRNGADCDRADCMFTHPVNEQCKFGVNCRNAKCVYQHPTERDETLQNNKPMVWVKDGPGSTSERQFAESDDQVMETIVPGSEPITS